MLKTEQISTTLDLKDSFTQKKTLQVDLPLVEFKVKCIILYHSESIC